MVDIISVEEVGRGYTKVVINRGRANPGRSVFYIETHIWEKMTAKEKNSELMLGANASVVVDAKYNTMIKCKWDLQEIIEVNVLQA